MQFAIMSPKVAKSFLADEAMMKKLLDLRRTRCVRFFVSIVIRLSAP